MASTNHAASNSNVEIKVVSQSNKLHYHCTFSVSRVYTNINQVSKNITQVVTTVTDTDSSVCP